MYFSQRGAADAVVSVSALLRTEALRLGQTTTLAPYNILMFTKEKNVRPFYLSKMATFTKGKI